MHAAGRQGSSCGREGSDSIVKEAAGEPEPGKKQAASLLDWPPTRCSSSCLILFSSSPRLPSLSLSLSLFAASRRFLSHSSKSLTLFKILTQPAASTSAVSCKRTAQRFFSSFLIDSILCHSLTRQLTCRHSSLTLSTHLLSLISFPLLSFSPCVIPITAYARQRQ